MHGTSFRAEVTLARMERGARELAGGRCGAFAADMSGFRCPRHFATAFGRFYFVPPRSVVRATKLARRLRRRSKAKAPPPTAPHYYAYFRLWRAEHQALLRTLKPRRRGTVLDELFADAIALPGPDLRTRDGKEAAASLAVRRPRRRLGRILRRTPSRGNPRASAVRHSRSAPFNRL
jgi:AraC-like DNA-binding protein